MRSWFLICLICLTAPAVVLLQPGSQSAASAENPFQHPPNPTVSQLGTLEQRFTPTGIYQQESIRGFTIVINPEVLRHPATAQELRKELNSQLAAITRAVPDRPLAALQTVRIWVEWKQRSHGAAEFHPSAAWLKQNGYNPEKAGCVEISNLHNFVQWSRTQQPWMLLHELAHAYHHLVLGDDYRGIEAAYQHAVAQKLYQLVDYNGGGKRRAYALTNAREYFAELSEAYFGKNDFYPFIRTELQHYDPTGYRLMQATWGRPRNANHGSVR